jgi:O-antigen/teichoic acid export membrane protein
LRPLLGDLLLIDGAKIFTLNVAGSGIAFVSHVLFARWLGVDSYGIYVFALGWLNILFIAVQAGMNISTVRFVSEYRASGDRLSIERLTGFSNLIVLCLSVVAAGIGVTVAALTLSGDDELRLTIYLVLALTAVMALIQQRTAILQGLERVVQATLIFEFARPLGLLFLAFVVGSLAGLDAARVMALNLAVSIATLVLLAVHTRRCIRREPADETADTESGPAPWRRWLKISLPYIAVTGMAILLTQMDILMIGHLLGPEQAGLYAPAAKVALLAVFPAVAIRARYGPLAARLYAEGKTADLQVRTKVATGLSVLACLGVLAVILPGRDLILGLFGAPFQAGGVTVLVLAAGYLLYSALGAVEMFFLVGPFEKANAVVAASTLGLNLILNLVLIPRFGIEGAAAATAVALVFRAFASAAIVHSRTGLLPIGKAASHGDSPS